jgi:photosystem II stability/assembly factor-like uncharacterized protein
LFFEGLCETMRVRIIGRTRGGAQGKLLGVAALGFVFGGLAFGQEIKAYDKKGEKAKYHATAVKGSPAGLRDLAYRQRLKMEADSFLGGVLWRNVGPEIQSGRVQMIAAPELDPKKVYVAFATGGLYRTEDEGQSWTSLWDNQAAFGIGDFAITKDGKTIYLGTGEANNQRTSYAGTGMYKSTDSGKTWQFIGLPESHHISRIIIDPKDENVVWACVMGHLYSQNPERGIYKTTDGGKTWNLVLGKDEYTGGNEVALNPKSTNIAVASLYERDRRAWNILESGEGSGSYRTEDGGKSWKLISTLPSGERCGRTGFAWANSDVKIVYAFVENPGKNEEWESEDERTQSGRLTPRRFFALTEDVFIDLDKDILKTFWTDNAPADLKLDDVLQAVKDKKMTMAEVRAKIETRRPNFFDPGQVEDELYKSTDGGKTFARVQKFGQIGGYYWNRVFVNPKDANDVWITALYALRSRDGGKTWKDGATRDVHVDYHAVYYGPQGIFLGNDGGAYLSRNDGKTWTHMNNLSVGQTTTVAVDNKTPYNIYTGLQDNGTLKGPSTYVPGVSPLDLWKVLSGGDGSAIAVDPRDDLDLVYTAIQFGIHLGIEQKTGKQYSASPRPPRGEGYRANWISPIQISTHHPDIVYVGFNRLYRSFDRGKSYKPISPDLTRNRPNGDVPHSTLKDISESPLKFGLIYAGADDGRMTMTPDGGNTWTDIPTPQPEKWISRVVASRFDENTVYVAQNGYREDDWSAFLWKSTDQGKTWRSIVGNLPAESINVVREDPKSKDTLYVGTDLGVFVTFDGGVTWETLHGGIGHLPVHDMVIQEREYDLVAATHAKGVFVLPLKQVAAITKEMREKDLTIITAADMVRSTSWGYERRSEWQGEPVSGPTLKVSFFSKSAERTMVELIGKDGKVVLSKEVNAIRGNNSADLSLKLTDGKPVILKKPSPKNGKDALADPYSDARATFLDKGEYKLLIRQGTKTVEKVWKLD